ncbi:MAG TPA: RIP metalloprotease RseP, partial [Candidatus Polarisedimenticolia bacterium]|nr:RIP metalloprotease RseP [Candidatus Polarisedimenticolia bacterium]
LFGITVEVFSVGFGPRLGGFKRGGTDYRLSAIPLGGYVKLKGETPEETTATDPGDLLSRPRWQRFLVFVMGAVFNLVTAFVLTAATYMIGISEPAYLDRPPVVAEVDQESPAGKAGLQAGDLITRFGDDAVATWKDLQTAVLMSPRQTKEIVYVRGGTSATTRLTVEAARGEVGWVGIVPETGVVVRELQPGRPAEGAGLRRGDRIVSIDGAPMTTLSRVFQAIGAAEGRPLRFAIERRGATLEKSITPVKDGERWVIGFVPSPTTVVRSYPFLTAMRQSLRSNLENATMVFTIFRKLARRELSLRTFSGPVDLFKLSGQTAREGLPDFLQFIAFVSLQLGIINLFPIPPLDGGHVFTILVEGAIRRDLSARLKERVMQVGLVLLLLFMGTVIYFDISKNFFP